MTQPEPLEPQAGASPLLLSLVLPAYNEEKRLAGSLERALAFLTAQDYAAEIVVVENGSTDRTWEIARAAAAADDRIRAEREPIRGKGAAVRRGMLAARGAFRVLCDVDFSMPVENLPQLLVPTQEDVDIAVGSREAPGSRRLHEPSHRHVMGRVFNGVIRCLLLPKFQDTQCGFKCFRAKAAEDVFRRLTRTGFSFDVEALVIADRLGYRVEEVPVRWRFDADSRVRLLQDTVSMVFDLLVIWWNARRGRYDR